ncbi:serine/threonine-protein kinase [Frankia sp. CiP3]|uniref:serine/threonine-protein kinase n=1 Tax=Frankia sp. CiP3 TaxID=2880971 RepID=UPI00210270D8|nr:serine/threonine-protein kinase [Frankia sp. CiP3]
MPLMPGDLDEEIQRRGMFPPAVAGRVTSQVAEALNAAHTRGVVHRDVKPANVLLYQQSDDQLYAYLADFGLARHTDAARLTTAGAMVGTPLYMSPEQLRGEPATAASDIYAAGLLLHEMMVGYPRCRGEECRRTPTDPVAARLHAVVKRACELEPEARHPSAEAFGQDIAAALTSAPVTVSHLQPLHQVGHGAARTQLSPDVASSGHGMDPAPSLDIAGGPIWTARSEFSLPDPGPTEHGHAGTHTLPGEDTIPKAGGAARDSGAGTSPAGQRRPVLLFALIACVALAVAVALTAVTPILMGRTDTASQATTPSHTALVTPSPHSSTGAFPSGLDQSTTSSPAPTALTTARISGTPVPLAQNAPTGTVRPPDTPVAPQSASLSPQPAPTTAAGTVQRRYVCAEDATLHSSFGPSTPIIGTLRRGEEFDTDGLLANNGAWVHGYAPSLNLSGWMLTQYVKMTCPAA